MLLIQNPPINLNSMNYHTLNHNDILYFKSIVSENNILLDNESLHEYSKDYTEDFSFLPELVLLPETVEQISQIAKFCHEKHIPLTCRGAGTGLSGACLPIEKGVVLSLKHFNKILNIDTSNYQAIVEPGVINEHLQNEVQKLGMFYPPDPASKGSCSIGGNVSHSSGGPRCVKYGTTKDYILNLEVVLPTGEIIQTGANVLKNSTGYNLTQLIVGSEGTLGIITKITLKLIPYPPFRALMLAYFSSAVQACAVVPEIFKAGVQPSAMEFMDHKGVNLSIKHQGIDFDTKDAKAYLLIEVDAFDLNSIQSQCETIYSVLENFEPIEVILADDAASSEKLWKIRRSIGEVVKTMSIYKEEDTVVTRSYLPLLYQETMAICEANNIEVVCYGHAGDGNLHINILKMDLDDEIWNNKLPVIIRQIFEICKKYGGTISGEHGIGVVQKSYLDIVMPPIQIDLMRQIKYCFDPHWILNPGKIFDRKL
jgi:glycolate oxidase